MWQMSLGVQHQVWPGVAAEFGYYRTWYGNWRATENVAVTPGDYDYYTFVAPRDPRLPDGGGDPGPRTSGAQPGEVGRGPGGTNQSFDYRRPSDDYKGAGLPVNAG